MLRPLEHNGLDSLHPLCPAHLLGALLPASQNKSSRREGSGSLRSFDALQQAFTSAFSEDFPNDVTAPLEVSFASFVPCSSLSLKRPEILLFPRDSESIRSRCEARDCQAPPVVRVLYESLGSGLTKDSGVLSLLFLRGRSFSARQRRYPLKGSWVPRLWRELLFSPSSPLRPTHRVKWASPCTLPPPFSQLPLVSAFTLYALVPWASSGKPPWCYSSFPDLLRTKCCGYYSFHLLAFKSEISLTFTSVPGPSHTLVMSFSSLSFPVSLAFLDSSSNSAPLKKLRTASVKANPLPFCDTGKSLLRLHGHKTELGFSTSTHLGLDLPLLWGSILLRVECL